MHTRPFIAAVLATTVGLAFTVTQADTATSQPTTAPTTVPAGPIRIGLPEFLKQKAQPNTVVLDVRTPAEFADGHVPGAINIDWHSRQFNERVQQLDKSKTYLVHCAGGVRSAAAVKRMQTLQFDSLFDYGGGFMEYEKSGQPIAR